MVVSLYQEEDGEEEDETDAKKPSKKRKLKAAEAEKNGLEELAALQSWLREKVPVEAVLPSEKLFYNPTGGVRLLSSASSMMADSLSLSLSLSLKEIWFSIRLTQVFFLRSLRTILQQIQYLWTLSCGTRRTWMSSVIRESCRAISACVSSSVCAIFLGIFILTRIRIVLMHVRT